MNHRFSLEIEVIPTKGDVRDPIATALAFAVNSLRPYATLISCNELPEEGKGS